jgi:hypothetical protein
MEEFMLEDLRRSVKEKEPSTPGKAGRERRLDVSQLIGVTSKGYQAVNSETLNELLHLICPSLTHRMGFCLLFETC